VLKWETCQLKKPEPCQLSSAETRDMSRPAGDTRVAGSGAREGKGLKGGCKGVSKCGVKVCGVVGTESGRMAKEGEEDSKVTGLLVEFGSIPTDD
jgi:hypothetical protein